MIMDYRQIDHVRKLIMRWEYDPRCSKNVWIIETSIVSVAGNKYPGQMKFYNYDTANQVFEILQAKLRQ